MCGGGQVVPAVLLWERLVGRLFAKVATRNLHVLL